MTDEQRRFAQSDAGRRLLEDIFWYFDTGDVPIGNCNTHNFLQIVHWGWLDRQGLTVAGKEACEVAGL